MMHKLNLSYTGVKSIKKNIGLIVILISAAAFFMVLKRYVSNPDSLIPYPYQINLESIDQFKAPIVIIGDQMGQNLYRYHSLIQKAASKNLNKAIEIESLALKEQGLHRTLARLKKMEIWPKILIYQGASEEAYESRFVLSQSNKIKKNFKKYQDDLWKTAMLFWPGSARLIYTPIRHKKLSAEVVLDQKDYQDFEKLKRNELIFKIYEMELRELIELSKEKGSELILLTTPINLRVPPKQSCTQLEMENAPRLSDIKKQMEAKDFKKAYTQASERAQMMIADPDSHFIAGTAAYHLGQYKKALHFYQKANAYNCELDQGNVIFNGIIKKVAREYQVPVFDAQDFLYADFGKNILFKDDHYPQDFYMEKLARFLGEKIKLMLNI